MDLFSRLDEIVGSNGLLASKRLLISDENLCWAFMQWMETNKNAWVAYDRMDVSKLTQPKVIAQDLEFDIRMLLAMVPETNIDEFWSIICQLGNRNVAQLQQMQITELNDAIDQFAAELTMFGLHIGRNELIHIVNDNREAIETRTLPHGIPIPASSLVAFWEHMENCYNLINPFNNAKQLPPNPVDKLVSKLIGVVGGSDPNNLDFGGMMQQITGDASFLDEMKNMFTTADGSFNPAILGDIFTNMNNTIKNLNK